MIKVQGLGKKFGGKWTFRDLSFDLRRGESAVVIGPSGAGKSVLLKIIAGLLTADDGTVSLASADVGMLFQKNALFDSLTVEENLLFPIRERKGLTGLEAHQLADSFLEAVGLSGFQKLHPDEISGGMQKRLGIARALVLNPEIILCDEPTAGLDPVTSRRIAGLMMELRGRSGSTLITVTNDMQRAYQIADRIFLLAQGCLIDGGTPTEVRATKNAELKQFIYGLKEGPLTSGLA